MGTKSLWYQYGEMNKQISSMPVCSLYATRTSEFDQKDCLLFYIMLQRHVLFILLIICYLHFFLSLNIYVFYFIYMKFLYKYNFDSACWLLLKSRNPRYEWWIVLSSHLSIIDAFYFVSLFSPFGNTLFFGYIIIVEKCCISNFE